LKKKYIKIIITGLVLSLLTLGSGFGQALSQTSEGQITYGSLLKDLGLVLGDLREDELITREEMVNYLAQVPMGLNWDKSNMPTGSPFVDISTDRWSYRAIEMLASRKALKADSNGKFNPTRPVTYEEAAQLIMRNLNVNLGRDQAIERAEKDQGIFSDSAKNQDYLTRGQFFELLAKMFNGHMYPDTYVLYYFQHFPRASLMTFETRLFDLRKERDVVESGWSEDQPFKLQRNQLHGEYPAESYGVAEDQFTPILSNGENQAR